MAVEALHCQEANESFSLSLFAKLWKLKQCIKSLICVFCLRVRGWFLEWKMSGMDWNSYEFEKKKMVFTEQNMSK